MLLAVLLAGHPPAQAAVTEDAIRWAVLDDPKGLHTIESVSTQTFEPAGGAPALGYRNGVVWLKLSIAAPTTDAGYGWLELRSSLLDSATLYAIGKDGRWRAQQAGDRLPLETRPLDYRNPVFRITWPDSQPITVYLKLVSTSTLSFPWSLHTPSSFVSAVGSEQLLFGVFYAIHLVLLVSSAWFWLSTRSLPFILFALSVLANLVSTLCAEGHAYQYLLPNQPLLTDALYVISWFAATPLGVLFACHYLGLFAGSGRRTALLATGLSALIALAAAPWLIWTNTPWLRPTYQLWGLLVSALLLATSCWQLLRGNRAARALALVQVLMFIGVGVRLARNTGLVAPGLLTDNSHYLGMMAFFLIMHSAVSRRYTDMRAEKEAAQAEALRAAREAEQRLEQQVAERTDALKDAMEQLQGALLLERRAQKQLHQLLATVSHELRTPLAIIDSATQNLLLGTGETHSVGKSTRRRYQKIHDASQRLTLLLKDALTDSRIALQRGSIKLSECSPATLLEDAAHAARVVSDAHQITVDASALPEHWICDPALTTLALRTLADNAVKYTPEGCEIKLDGRLENGHLVLRILDNGPGILLSELPHLFEHGFRGSASRRHPGSGQGLPLARQMLTWQGGSLDLENLPTGGCIASLRLPPRALDDQLNATGTVSA